MSVLFGRGMWTGGGRPHDRGFFTDPAGLLVAFMQLIIGFGDLPCLLENHIETGVAVMPRSGFGNRG